jgi:hypothetical protein
VQALQNIVTVAVVVTLFHNVLSHVRAGATREALAVLN